MRAACARRQFGLSGDDKAAHVIADSNKGRCFGEIGKRGPESNTVNEKSGAGKRMLQWVFNPTVT